jgi:ATP-binding cassette subfamily D (ALD) long-chain fatty acid import protein
MKLGLGISGGQKQRLMMARLFWHVPKFAILDEATSAISKDIRDQLFKECKDLGITLIVVSHKAELKQFCNFELKLLGERKWELVELNQEN